MYDSFLYTSVLRVLKISIDESQPMLTALNGHVEITSSLFLKSLSININKWRIWVQTLPFT